MTRGDVVGYAVAVLWGVGGWFMSKDFPDSRQAFGLPWRRVLWIMFLLNLLWPYFAVVMAVKVWKGRREQRRAGKR